MKASLVNRNWNIFENTSVHESSESLFNEIKSVVDFYAPEKTIALNAKRYSTNEPWLTQGLKKCARKCLTMYDKVLKKPRDSPEFQNYKQYCNMYNKL